MGIKDALSSMADLITDHNSNTLRTSLSAIVTDIRSRLGESSRPTSPPTPVHKMSRGTECPPMYSTHTSGRQHDCATTSGGFKGGDGTLDGSGNIAPGPRLNNVVLHGYSDMARPYGYGSSGESTVPQERRDVARVVCAGTDGDLEGSRGRGAGLRVQADRFGIWWW